MVNIAGYPSAVIQGFPGKSGRIQGLGGFVPSDLAGLEAWFDAGQGIILNGVVSEWQDQSGNGNHLIQLTPANGPSFNPGPLPSVQFDGVNDNMATAAFAAPLSQPNTIFLVYARTTGAISGEVVYAGINLGSRNQFTLTGLPPGASNLFAGTLRSGTNSSGIVNETKISTVVFNEANSKSFFEGVPDTLAAGTIGTQALTGFNLGARPDLTNFAHILVQEAIVYDREITNIEKNQVGNYLANKWGLTWTDIFDPSNINGLTAWYDGRSGIILNGADVSQWDDRSGNGNNLLQATASKQPFFDNAGADPFVLFDGITELLQLSAFGSGDQPQPNTFVIAVRVVVNTINDIIFDSAVSGKRHFIDLAGGGQARLFAGSASISGDTNLSTTKHIIAVVVDGVNSQMYIDGGLDEILGEPTPGSNVLAGFSLGAKFNETDHSNLESYGITIYNRALSIQELNQVGNFFKNSLTGFSWTDI